MPIASLSMLLLLSGCGDKGTDSGEPTADGGATDGGGTDGGTTDGGTTDGGATGEEDCGSEGDEDGDGLADCEDPDCAEVCMEDCGNEVDDDGDGLIDCDDDECAGSKECMQPYTLTLATDLDYLHWAYGDDIAARTGGDRASMSLFGIVALSVEPDGWAGDSFSCTGEITADTLAGGPKSGALSYLGTGTEVDYRFSFEATTDAGLTWFEDCPVSTLGTWELGALAGTPTIARDQGGGWVDAYGGGSFESYTGEYGGLSYTIQWTWNPDQLSAPSWDHNLRPPD